MAGKQSILDACRHALRLPATFTDDDEEIQDLIDSARASLRSGGVTADVAADDENGTVRLAIKCFVKANYGLDNSDMERYQKSFDDLKCLMAGDGEFNGSAS